MYQCITSGSHRGLATSGCKHADDWNLNHSRRHIKSITKAQNGISSANKMVAAVWVFVRKQVLFIFYLLDLEEPWDTDQGALFEIDHGGGFPRIYLFS